MAWRSRIRAFLDSNVIVSGIHSPDGPPGIILRLYMQGEFQVVVSQLVLDQVIRGIKRKMPSELQSLQEFLLQYPPEVCPDPTVEEISHYSEVIHAEDAPILAAAIASGVDYLVTGDKHFLSKASILHEKGIKVVSPAQFLEILP